MVDAHGAGFHIICVVSGSASSPSESSLLWDVFPVYFQPQVREFIAALLIALPALAGSAGLRPLPPRIRGLSLCFIACLLSGAPFQQYFLPCQLVFPVFWGV